MAWERLAAISELDGSPRVIRQSGRQVAVFQAGDEYHVIDNRCPHEGYPLAEGSVDDNCVLTCNWHNWKFKLDDGSCILGGDDVRAYPVRVTDGFVLADLSDPPIEEVEAKILKGLQRAFHDRDYGWICREITRLKLSGIDPLTAVRSAIQWSYDRFEFGFTHAYAAASDWLGLSSEFEDDWEKQLICLASPVDHMAFDAQRHPEYPYAEVAGEYSATELLAAVEAEDYAGTEGLIGKALTDGLHFADLEETLATAALAHFQGFGHALIYVYKNGQLIQRLGESVERPLLLAEGRDLCYSTREDLIPEFAAYGEAVEALPISPGSSTELVPVETFFPMPLKKALDAVINSLATHTPETLFDAMLHALAKSVLHYDVSVDAAWDRPVKDNVGWLNLTHGLTFANAVHVLCSKYPQLWGRGLLQMACFIGRNHHYLDHSVNESDWVVEDVEQFDRETRDTMLDHGFRDPIFSAHIVKTPLAVFEEAQSASPGCRRSLLASLNRFLHSPIKQFHARRLAQQAITLVERDYAG